VLLLRLVTLSIIPDLKDTLPCKTVCPVQCFTFICVLRCNTLFHDWKHYFDRLPISFLGLWNWLLYNAAESILLDHIKLLHCQDGYAEVTFFLLFNFLLESFAIHHNFRQLEFTACDSRFHQKKFVNFRVLYFINY